MSLNRGVAVVGAYLRLNQPSFGFLGSQKRLLLYTGSANIALQILGQFRDRFLVVRKALVRCDVSAQLESGRETICDGAMGGADQS